MSNIKKCIDLINDMFKGVSFDPEKPIEMNQYSRYYSPYKYVDNGFLPYDSNYWRQQGKDVQMMDDYNPYYRNDNFLRNYGINKSEITDILEELAKSEAVSKKIRKLKKEGKPQDQAVAIALDMERRGDIGKAVEFALDSLSKGGPGSGRKPETESGYHWKPTDKNSVFYQNPFKTRVQEARMKDIMARKEKEDKEKEEKEKKDKDKKAAEKHKEEVRRLVSYLKSEDIMSNDEKLLKAHGFTSEPVNLIHEVKEDESISKAIKDGNIQPGGRHDLNWHQRPNQVMMKAYGSENLKDNHAEKVHKDNDKKMEKEVSKIEEVKYPEEEKEPKSRKLNDIFTGKSETLDALNSLMKANGEEIEEEGEEMEAEGEEMEGEGEEVGAAEEEALAEMKKERVAGTERGAEEEGMGMKSFSLADLAKACGDYMASKDDKDKKKDKSKEEKEVVEMK